MKIGRRISMKMISGKLNRTEKKMICGDEMEPPRNLITTSWVENSAKASNANNAPRIFEGSGGEVIGCFRGSGLRRP